MEQRIYNPKNSDTPLRGARVLVVEDDALLLKTMLFC